jgi:hypothetical protein
VYAQEFEVQQLLLNVEKLSQLKQLLADMKKGYDVVMKGYTTVRDISNGNFKIHQFFLDNLMAASPTVRRYKRIGDIISIQLALVKEYKVAFRQFKNTNVFNAGEIGYLDNVYDNLIKKSLKNLEDLTLVITANQLRMNDNERITEIDRIHADMSDKLTFLRSFNDDNIVLAVQRMQEQVDIDVLRKMYDFKKR